MTQKIILLVQSIIIYIYVRTQGKAHDLQENVQNGRSAYVGDGRSPGLDRKNEMGDWISIAELD